MIRFLRLMRFARIGAVQRTVDWVESSYNIHQVDRSEEVPPKLDCLSFSLPRSSLPPLFPWHLSSWHCFSFDLSLFLFVSFLCVTVESHFTFLEDFPSLACLSVAVPYLSV